MAHVPLLALLGCLSATGPPPGFLAQHDLVWEVAPPRWLEGIPLANGDMGALVWGDGAPLRLTLDKYDAWETREKPLDITYDALRSMVAGGRREEAEQAMRTQRIYGEDPYPTRLPMPRVELDFRAPLDWSSARLRLETAAVEIDGRLGGQPVRLEILVHANRNLLIVRCEGIQPGGIDVKVGLDHLNDGAKATLARWGYPAPVSDTGDEGQSGNFHQRTPTGYEYAIAWRKVPAAGGTVLFLSLLSSEDTAAPLEAARALISEAAQDAGGRADHEAWWADYWARSWLTIPDARLEALYYAEMYKLACSSRPGKLPITLQGLWTLDGGMPPWSGDYHLDMNVQQSYWPIYTANRLDLGEPLYRTFSACLPRWREQCREFFGFDGIWAGCAIGPKGERVFGYSGVELWPGNAAWLAHHYWLHYRYSQDLAFLRDEALPMISLSFLTYANLLEEDAEGRLRLPLSYSPEYHEGRFEGYTANPNGDLALIRWMCEAIIESNAVLGETHELTARAEDTLTRLVPYVHRDHRLWVSEGTPLEHSHRHHSHLMAIHPLGLITRHGGEEDRAFIRNSLRDIRVLGTGQWTGWAFPWMSLIAARAGYGNMAWQMLDVYANSFITPNTFHINGDPRIFGLSMFDYEPMTLEAGFGAAAAVMEMLIQSPGGQIEVFPVLPDRWHDAYFENLRAEGAFVLSSQMEAGRIRYVAIHSEAGQPCRITNPFDGPARLVTLTPSGAVADETIMAGAKFEFATTPGGRYLLAEADQALEELDLRPKLPTRNAEEANFYGVKRRPRF